MKKRRIKFPILVKTIILIFVLAAIVVEVAVAYYSFVMSNTNQQNYKMFADNLAETTALSVDIEDFKYIKNEVKTKVDASTIKPIIEEEDAELTPEEEAYFAQFDYLQEDPIFNKTRDYLRSVSDANGEYVDCVYLIYLDVTNKMFIYLCDSAPLEDACNPGVIDPLYEVNYAVLDDVTRGFPAYITDTKYGWLVTAGAPVYDTDKSVIGYAAVDISMNVVRGQQADSIVRLFLYLVFTVTLIMAIGVVIVYFIFVRPVKKLSHLAESYDSDNPEKTHEQFKDFKLKTRDEIEVLSNSLKNMEGDINDRIKQLVLMNAQLATSREQTKKMTILANKDGLTGVQNKVAYDSETSRIDEEISLKTNSPFGVVMIDLNYLKNTNDEYGHEAGDIILIKLANIICQTFTHSPVYRIGGDEFVVLLRGKDYENRDKLIEKFNKAIYSSINDKKIPEQERVSAAIGLSIFIEGDSSVHDVFKRADKAMYLRKHEMKFEGK